MRELALALRAGRDASRLAALTVDDGYRDCYLYAYPVLQHYQVPATVYVTPGFIDGQLWYWPDRIRYILDEAPGSRLLLSYAGLPAEYDLSTPAKRHYAWKVIADYCFWLTSVARESWLEKFASDLSVVVPSVSPEEYAPLSWAEVREMASAGVEIGSHTMTHPRLVQIGGSELADEVKMSKARIEEEIGRTVHSFCYPYGTWADVGPAARDAVERSGYISAVLAEARRAPQLDPFAIGRMNVDVTSMPHFLRLVSGIDALIPGRGGC
jgi:peptidoglycan/xylan/chitin deacetylase (PgdA/CDA1 family)